ncbi:hypothetical protein PO909_016911 [Leuciscus waleckii]
MGPFPALRGREKRPCVLKNSLLQWLQDPEPNDSGTTEIQETWDRKSIECLLKSLGYKKKKKNAGMLKVLWKPYAKQLLLFSSSYPLIHDVHNNYKTLLSPSNNAEIVSNQYTAESYG